ncbi:MAG TPA: tetratricopeptide repeat protein [Solirubrobacterales bacterium]|nr:tetratricopeptide repeat protein [Solirubrobacterales bacterium]
MRGLDQPPIFVIQGVRGNQKSELLDHFLFTYKKRGSWRNAEDTDAKVDFFSIDPEPEAIFTSIAQQLAARRLRLLRFPRFERIQALLREERRRAGIASPTHATAVENDNDWLLTAGVGVVKIATDASIPAPSPSLLRYASKLRRAACRKVPLTKAARWTKRFEQALPGRLESPDSPRRRIEMLREGLGSAIVEDLRQATRRKVLPVGQVAIFIDGYHRVERSSQPELVAEFAKQLGESEARVMVVVACREQEHWSALAEAQPDHKHFDTMETSARIQIHHLQPIAYPDRIRSLVRDEVHPDLAPDLARRSMGVPLMVKLLGAAFGRDTGIGLHRYRSLLAALPQPEEGAEFKFDDAWFERFSRTIVSDVVRDIDREMLLHLRAAATQRNFDRGLLAELLGDRFSERCFEELVRSDFVGTPRPSLLLGAERSYRVRSFVRDALAADTSEAVAVERWHQRAADHFEQKMGDAPDQEAAFRFQTEALFHQLFTEPENAKSSLFRRFESHLLASRTDRCEALLRIALDFDRSDPHWRATVLTHAGKMYMARGRHPLAEERLKEAKALVSLDEDDSWLAVTIALALAKCYRLQERLDEARAEWAALRRRARVHPVVEFQATWSDSLEQAYRGNLSAASDLVEEAARQLEALLDPARAQESERAAEAFGLASLPRKGVHIVRHEADIARRAGDYALSAARTEEALAGYRHHPEDGIEAFAELNRVHVLRQDGKIEESAMLAKDLHGHFLAPRTENLRGAAEALRCLAHAQLCGSEPERARPALDALVNVDPRLYPRARRFGLFGLGELERLLGALGEARVLYRRSEEECRKNNHFEYSYAGLGMIELDRIECPQRVPGEIRQLLNQPGVKEHPILPFYAGLIGIRTHGYAAPWSAMAEAAAARIVRAPGDEGWEAALLERTRTAVESGAELPSLAFNVP